MKKGWHGHDGIATINLLFSIVTINEASHHWGKHRQTIYGAIDRGYILARAGKNGWLIEVESLINYWGEPKIPLKTTYDLNFPPYTLTFP